MRRTGALPVSLILFLIFPLQSILAFNSSTTQILQDVLKKISAKHKWYLQDIRVSRLDASRVRFGSAQRYEFRVGFGKIPVGVLFSDDVASWKKFRQPRTHFGSLVKELSSKAVVDTFKVEGPFELRVGGTHHLSLSLPCRGPIIDTKLVGTCRMLRRGLPLGTLFLYRDFPMHTNTTAKKTAMVHKAKAKSQPRFELIHTTKVTPKMAPMVRLNKNQLKKLDNCAPPFGSFSSNWSAPKAGKADLTPLVPNAIR